jgi:hypothetical protein
MKVNPASVAKADKISVWVIIFGRAHHYDFIKFVHRFTENMWTSIVVKHLDRSGPLGYLSPKIEEIIL